MDDAEMDLRLPPGGWVGKDTCAAVERSYQLAAGHFGESGSKVADHRGYSCSSLFCQCSRETGDSVLASAER